MSKLTREQKIEIYTKRKCGETVISLSRQYPVEIESIKYRSCAIQERILKVPNKLNLMSK